ncbi:CinA family nicotinamide mononucleotide deamidase-related protein [Thermomonospora cellulosilytica]|uniref:CinA-like protein n=1 Tax=Thermomonospora cellulosilytica TaxID=1411118 RepID=A0A7W3N3N1_9ACTN|nr:CinA family nicotinamide mononucleotide deamidase-related protein [Thermomonospora cellulosilytica]MBA9006966.1 nicotinamide-nucleotide amidase [Thermomonospora cellulosilytica]
MRVELVTVGDELLLGDTVNGNAAWLGRRLAEAGVEVTRSVVVGDLLAEIVEAVTAALGRADAVIVTGGLGPTYDDLTRDALAAAAGVPLVLDKDLERRLRDRVAAAGRTLVPMALRMAEVPEGARVLPNPVGSAPGLRVKLPGGVAYALPGVPREMRAIMTGTVLPELRAAISGTPAVRRILRTAGVWESELADRLAPVEALEGVRLAYLPDPAEVRVRITATGPDAEALAGRAERMARELLGPAVYGEDADTLDRVVHRLLAERSATVATAESLTGGLLGAELTAMPGSSATYAGGVVAYATRLKHELLGVPRELLDAEGAVHPDVAAAMAAGVRDRLGATYGLAVTGVAGPEPQDGRPVGTVYIAVAGPGCDPRVTAPDLPVPSDAAAARAPVRRMTVVHALDLLRRTLLGVAGETGRDDLPAHREERG